MKKLKSEQMVADAGNQRTLWEETWRRFKKNKLAMAGMIFMLILVVLADVYKRQAYGSSVQDISELLFFHYAIFSR